MGRGRKPCCDKANVKKGPWSQIEDYKLTSFIQKYGHDNWRALPRLSGLARCGKSCRLRWINYLRPGLKRGDFSSIEEEAIIKLHEELGNKWSIIASKFPGRTDNEIKNVWNTYLKKRIKAKECNKVSLDDCSLDENSSSPSSSYSSSQQPPFSDHDIKHLNPILDDLGVRRSNTIDNVVLQDDTGGKTSSIDEVIEIPFEPNLDLWDLLDGDQPNSINLATKNDQISENMNDLDCGVSKWWLVYLENELGLDHNEGTSYQSTIDLKS